LPRPGFEHEPFGENFLGGNPKMITGNGGDPVSHSQKGRIIENKKAAPFYMKRLFNFSKPKDRIIELYPQRFC
jgi:hypothetical protein